MTWPSKKLWPCGTTKPENYDDLKAKAHEMAEGYGTSVQHTGLLYLGWPDHNPQWFPAVLLHGSHGFPHKTLDEMIVVRGMPPWKEGKTYLQWWPDNMLNFNSGVDWYIPSFMTPENWARIVENKRSLKYHPHGPTFQVRPWASPYCIDDHRGVERKPRIKINWWALEPHYCCWDEFRDKDYDLLGDIKEDT